jgi:hypothetical protein
MDPKTVEVAKLILQAKRQEIAQNFNDQLAAFCSGLMRVVPKRRGMLELSAETVRTAPQGSELFISLAHPWMNSERITAIANRDATIFQRTADAVLKSGEVTDRAWQDTMTVIEEEWATLTPGTQNTVWEYLSNLCELMIQYDEVISTPLEQLVQHMQRAHDMGARLIAEFRQKNGRDPTQVSPGLPRA